MICNGEKVTWLKEGFKTFREGVWNSQDASKFPNRAALEAAGMDCQLVEDLAVRAAALRHAQSVWASERF
jgi:hypothetical protein